MKKVLFSSLAAVLALGLGLLLAQCGGGGKKCTKDEDCKVGMEFCDRSTGTCKPVTTCDPVQNCQGKCGGPNGCGGVCPNTCPAGQVCNTTNNTCQTCTPDCTGRECGPDPVCGQICGTCTAPKTCDATGHCVGCVKNCTGRVCGPDPVCGESCGTCPNGYTCNAAGQCEQGCVEPGAPCPNHNECPPEWPQCLEGPDFTYCSKSCNSDADCSCNACCLEIQNGQKACFDHTQCPGSAEAGDPCPFGSINPGAVNCKSGLVCLGTADLSSQPTCTQDSQCTNVDSAWNRDCADGHCGFSFCSAPCTGPNNDECDTNFMPGKVGEECYCIPEPVDKACSDPVQNLGCPQGQMCVPAGGDALACDPEGTQDVNQTCNANNNCKAGLLCIGSGGNGLCLKMCDTNKNPAEDVIPNADCPNDYGCFGINGINRWGVCDYIPICVITNGPGACPPETHGGACIPWYDDCSAYRCIFNENKQVGNSCQYINSCGPGLICEGDASPTCKEVCNPAQSTCPSPKTCQAPAGLCNPVPTDWGVCK